MIESLYVCIIYYFKYILYDKHVRPINYVFQPSVFNLHLLSRLLPINKLDLQHSWYVSTAINCFNTYYIIRCHTTKSVYVTFSFMQIKKTNRFFEFGMCWTFYIYSFITLSFRNLRYSWYSLLHSINHPGQCLLYNWNYIQHIFNNITHNEYSNVF